MPRRGTALLLIGFALATSCQSSIPPTGSPPPSPSSDSPASEPITIQVYDLPSLSNRLDLTPFAFTHFIVVRMVHAAMYRHDASLAPVPDLAAEPCDVGDDLVTISCVVRSATFHDGSPVTADDVAFTYELAKSPNCPFFSCLTEQLERVEAVDSQTVRFTLTRPYAPFLSTGLSDIFIEPRALIERAYEEFAARLRESDPEALRAVAGQIQEGLGAAEPDCESSLEAGEQALRELGIPLADRGLFVLSQRFDACAYASYLVTSVQQAALSSEGIGTDAIAAAYPLLSFVSFNSDPVGAGPWRLSSFDPGTGLVLTANPAYHHGEPLVPEVHVRPMRDDGEIQNAMIAGGIDWLNLPPPQSAIDVGQLREEPSIKLAEHTSLGYLALQYNQRAGRVFSDRNLRQAVELCIDKERTVEATTEEAVAIHSNVPPGSWAHQPGLAKQRDVEAARRLIEASGWSIGQDEIYEKDGRRLAAEVVVRADVGPYVAFLDRVVAQVRDCGIELTPRLVEFSEVVTMLETFPHLMPGSSEPFDVYLGGWGLAFDPDAFDLFHSSRIPTESRTGPLHLNYIGFSNPQVDALLEEGLATYDQARRTEIYRELQRVLAQEQPYYFAFAATTIEALDADLTSSDGPLDLSSPRWWWRLEALVNPAE